MKNNKIVKGFIKLKRLPASYLIDPKLVSAYRNKQNTIVNFLKDIGYQEIHTSLFISKNLFPISEDRVTKWLISTFSGKDKRVNFDASPSIYLTKKHSSYFDIISSSL